jgi:hypothetical protein
MNIGIKETRTVLAQYVYASKAGLFRIVSHGHRWRVLLDDREVGRYPNEEVALASLRHDWSAARLPVSLDSWRYLPAPTLAHLPPPSTGSMARLAAAA